ncbi:hypothetical protein P692DRAFT_20741214 [Suillus brevipes Sb2]|nr:hypothetical protein P692DRAFT_20741214 [Suillus brevipes Sb2]
MLPTSNKFICVCQKYGLGRPHSVSKSTWYQHLQQASTEEKKARMHDQSVASGSSLPPSSRRAAAIQTLAKRARKNQDTRRVGRRKCAQTTSMDHIVHHDDFVDPNDPPVPDNDPPESADPDNDPPVPDNDPPVPDNDPPVPDNDPPVPDNDPPNPPNPPNEPQYQYVLQRQPQPNIDVDAMAELAKLPKIKETMEYILALKNATLEDPMAKLGDDALERLRNPPQGPITIDSPGIRHSISMYLALEHASQEAYDRIMRSTRRNFTEADGIDDLLSFYRVERLIAEYTGVESIKHDMCLNSCLAFTGPFADLDNCPMCGTSRWDPAKLRASNGRTKIAAQTSASSNRGRIELRPRNSRS